MELNSELAELLSELDAVSERVAQWEMAGSLLDSGGFDEAPEPSRGPWTSTEPAAPLSTGAAVSGDGPAAAEERSIRIAASSLSRARARQVRDELAVIRARASRMAEKARSSAAAGRAQQETASLSAAVSVALRTAIAQLVGVEDLDEAMNQIVAGALRVVPGARWGGICVETSKAARLRKRARNRSPLAEGTEQVSVHAASDPIVTRLETLQARDGEGPCVQALATAETLHVPDLLAEQRWSHFVQVATELGVRSALAISLPVSPPGGVLNLYGPFPEAFDDDARALAELFADHAAITLVSARRVGQLSRAVESRDLIGQAKGILMHRHAVTAERAFWLLTEASQTSNIKVVDVARWVIDNAGAL